MRKKICLQYFIGFNKMHKLYIFLFHTSYMEQ